MDEALRTAIKQIESLGAEAIEVSFALTPYAIPVYYLILFAEASSISRNMMRVASGTPNEMWKACSISISRLAKKDLERETKRRRIMLGTFALSAGYYDAYYLKAQFAH